MPRRKIIRTVAIVAGLMLLAALVLLKLPPAAYRRTAGMGDDETAVARFNEEVLNKVGNVMLDRSRQTRLELTLTEDMVNARIARSLADEAARGRPLPPILRDLRIGFEPGRVVVATRLGQSAGSIVVSQGLGLSVGPEGSLVVEPGDVAVGVVPIPGVGAAERVRQAIERQIETMEASGDETDIDTLDVLRSVRDALDGQPVPLGKGKKLILLDSIEIERGVLKIEGHRP